MSNQTNNWQNSYYEMRHSQKELPKKISLLQNQTSIYFEKQIVIKKVVERWWTSSPAEFLEKISACDVCAKILKVRKLSSTIEITRRYVQGEIFLFVEKKWSKINSLLNSIKEFHKIIFKTNVPIFKPLKILEFYGYQKGAEDPDFLFLENWNINNKLVFSHNDLQPWNVIWSDAKAILIDLDHVMKNDYLYDFATVACEYQLDEFLSDYLFRFLNLTEIEKKRFKMWQKYQSFLWLLFANYMWVKNKNDVYALIYKHKFNFLEGKTPLVKNLTADVSKGILST